MDAIRIKKGLLEEMSSHARSSLPNEACGLLGAAEDVIVRLYRTENIDASAMSYRFDPAEQMTAMKELSADGLALAAIYHSHPHSPPYPSQTDIKLAFFPGTEEPNFPGVAYVIVSLAGERPEARAYSITPGGVKELRLVEV
jgi:proteasome lid subunit RPN8/RPN11